MRYSSLDVGYCELPYEGLDPCDLLEDGRTDTVSKKRPDFSGCSLRYRFRWPYTQNGQSNARRNSNDKAIDIPMITHLTRSSYSKFIYLIPPIIHAIQFTRRGILRTPIRRSRPMWPTGRWENRHCVQIAPGFFRMLSAIPISLTVNTK